MHITSHPHHEGQLFTLTAECSLDLAFIDALHLQNHVAVQGFERTPWANGCQANVGVSLLVGQTAQALRAKAGSEFASAFGNLMRLSLGDAAGHGHISTDAAKPQPQEQLAASLENLQFMVQSLGEVVGQQGALIQKMASAHGGTSVSIHVDTAGIVDQQGGAA